MILCRNSDQLDKGRDVVGSTWTASRTAETVMEYNICVNENRCRKYCLRPG